MYSLHRIHGCGSLRGTASYGSLSAVRVTGNHHSHSVCLRGHDLPCGNVYNGHYARIQPGIFVYDLHVRASGCTVFWHTSVKYAVGCGILDGRIQAGDHGIFPEFPSGEPVDGIFCIAGGYGGAQSLCDVRGIRFLCSCVDGIWHICISEKTTEINMGGERL